MAQIKRTGKFILFMLTAFIGFFPFVKKFGSNSGKEVQVTKIGLQQTGPNLINQPSESDHPEDSGEGAGMARIFFVSGSASTVGIYPQTPYIAENLPRETLSVIPAEDGEIRKS